MTLTLENEVRGRKVKVRNIEEAGVLAQVDVSTLEREGSTAG